MNEPDSPSAYRVISNPLLRREIIHHVNHPETLLRCAQSCRLLKDEAIPVLWRGRSPSISSWPGPSLGNLRDLAKSEKAFRYYTSFIQSLSITIRLRRDWRAGDGQLIPREFFDNEVQLRNLFTTQLWSGFKAEKVHVDYWYKPTFVGDYLKRLIHPGLRILTILSGSYKDDFFDHVHITTQLRSLWLRPLSRGLARGSSRGISRPFVLRPMHNLVGNHAFERLRLDVDGPGSRVFHQLFMVALQNQNVRYFTFTSIDGNLYHHRLQGGVSQLRSLEVDVRGLDFEGLFQRLPLLENFKIVYKDDELDIGITLLSQIVVCPRLIKLEILAKLPSYTVQSGQLIYFATQTTQLQKFDFHLHQDTYCVGTVQPFELVAIMRSWPQLRWLVLETCTAVLGASELKEIADSCPELLFLSTRADADIDIFKDRSLLFPKLRRFGLKFLRVDLPSTSKEAARAAVWDGLDEAQPDSRPSQAGGRSTTIEGPYIVRADDLLAEVKAILLSCMPNLEWFDAKCIDKNRSERTFILEGTSLPDLLFENTDWPEVMFDDTERKIEQEVLHNNNV